MLLSTGTRLFLGAPFLKSTVELRTAGRWLVAMYQIHIYHQQVVWKLGISDSRLLSHQEGGALHFSQV